MHAPFLIAETRTVHRGIPMIRAIIFDWHGVLDKTTYRGFSKFLSGITGKDADWIRDQVSAHEQKYIKGEITPDVFWSELKVKLSLSDAQYGQAREHLLTVRLNQDLWAQLPELQKLYQLAVLSDCPSDKLAVIRKTASFEYFAATQFSCQSGMGKEVPAFFLAVCARLGVQPVQCLYVDDTSKHIETSSKLGFLTYLFVNTEGFNRHLHILSP